MAAQVRHIKEIQKIQSYIFANLNKWQRAIASDTVEIIFKNNNKYVILSSYKYYDGSWHNNSMTFGELNMPDSDITCNSLSMATTLNINNIAFIRIKMTGEVLLDVVTLEFLGKWDFSQLNTLTNDITVNGETIGTAGAKLSFAVNLLTLSATNTIIPYNIFTEDLTEYAGTSTVVGWDDPWAKSIKYKRIGKTVFVYYVIIGISNDVYATFTLPYAVAYGFNSAIATVKDDGNFKDGGWINGGTVDGTVCECYIYPYRGWTETGIKWVEGQFIYEKA